MFFFKFSMSTHTHSIRMVLIVLFFFIVKSKMTRIFLMFGCQSVRRGNFSHAFAIAMIIGRILHRSIQYHQCILFSMTWIFAGTIVMRRSGHWGEKNNNNTRIRKPHQEIKQIIIKSQTRKKNISRPTTWNYLQFCCWKNIKNLKWNVNLSMVSDAIALGSSCKLNEQHHEQIAYSPNHDLFPSFYPIAWLVDRSENENRMSEKVCSKY